MTNKELKEKLNSLKEDKDRPSFLPRILTQAQAIMQNKEYIRKRANGEIVFLDTCYPKLNKALMLENQKQLKAVLSKNDTLAQLMDKYKSLKNVTIIKKVK